MPLDEPLPAFPATEKPFNPFTEIWLHPRLTVRRLVETDPEKCVLLLACLMGVGSALDRAAMRNLGDKYDWPMIVVIACIGGPIGGMLMLWLYSHLLRWTGGWIGGISARGPLRTALAWSWVPAIVAIPLWIPSLYFFGRESFNEGTSAIDANPLMAIPMIGIGLIEVVLGLWSLVLLCHAVAEVQGFRSAWKGAANILVAGLVIFVPLAIIFTLILFAFA